MILTENNLYLENITKKKKIFVSNFPKLIFLVLKKNQYPVTNWFYKFVKMKHIV